MVLLSRTGVTVALLVATASIVGCGSGEAGTVSTDTVTVPATHANAPAQSSSVAGTSGSGGTTATGTASTATTTSANAGAASGPLAQADAICARRNRELAGVPPAGATLAAGAVAASKRAAIEQRALTELRGLTPPAKIAREWHLVLRESATALRGEREAAQAHGGAAPTKASAGSKQPQLRLLLAGVRAGVRSCSSVG